MAGSSISRKPVIMNQITIHVENWKDWGVQEIEDFHHQDLKVLMIIVAFLSWPVAVRFFATEKPRTLGLFIGLGLSLLIAYLLRNKNLSLAAFALIGGLLISVTVEIVVSPEPIAHFYFIPVIISAGMVMGPTWILAVGAVTLLLLLGLHGAAPVTAAASGNLTEELIITGATAIMVSFNARQIQNSIYRTMYYALQTRSALIDARDRAAQLARVAKALDVSNYSLKKAYEKIALARDEADRARQMKTHFANMISHEMRAPLNFIIGATELMTNSPEVYGKAPWPEGLHEDILHVHSNSRHLAQLIDDVLTLGQIEAHRMILTFEKQSLAEVIGEVIAIMQPVFESNGLYLKTDISQDIPLLLFDRVRIRQVLLNLLNNARRFTRVGGVTTRVAKQGEDVIVTVEDTGCGISPTHLPLLFHEFYQIQNPWPQTTSGSGLGLSISKQFVEMHGGQIWAESPVQKPAGDQEPGSRFSFTLPVAGQVVVPCALPGGEDYWKKETAEAKAGRIVLIHSNDRVSDILPPGLSGYHLIISSDQEPLFKVLESTHPYAVVEASPGQVHGETQAYLDREDVPLIRCQFRLSKPQGPVTWNDYLVKPVTPEQVRDSLTRLGLQPRRCLVIDDDPQMQRFMELTLKPIEVLYASNQQDGLTLLAQCRPDVVFLDLSLPDSSGLDVLRSIRESSDTADVPVIIISALDNPQRDETHLVGLNLVRHRPFNRQEVAGALQGMLDAIHPDPSSAQSLAADLAAEPAF